jgi:hypothetical protein
MAVAGHTASIVVDASGLRDWAGQEALRGLASLRLTTYAAACAAATATAFLAVTGNLLPLELVFVLQLAARHADRNRLEHVLNTASGKARELETLSQLLLYVESAALSAPRLARDGRSRPPVYFASDSSPVRLAAISVKVIAASS